MMKIEPIMKVDYTATYKKYEDIAKVSRAEFSRRVRKKEMDIYDALTVRKYDSSERMKYKRIAAKNGISGEVFNKRLRNNWSYERASTQRMSRISREGKKRIREGQIRALKERNSAKGEMDNMEYEIKMLLKAGIPIRKKKYVDFINNNKELFEGMI